MKLLVRHLDCSTKPSELNKLFEAVGIVQSCTVDIDAAMGEFKAFGFIEMPKVGDEKAALKILNAKLVGGHKIRVKKAYDKSV